MRPPRRCSAAKTAPTDSGTRAYRCELPADHRHPRHSAVLPDGSTLEWTDD